MKTHLPTDPESNRGDRLMDALLNEHARAGNTSDEAFLQRLERALDADLPSARKIERENRLARRIIWSLGLAASVILVAGLTLPMVIRQHKKADWRMEHASNSERMKPLRPGFPAELIEGTPKPIILPSRTPDGSNRIITPSSELENPIPAPPPAAQPPPADRERYGELLDNRWTSPKDEPLSTFSIDVDTASYTNLRRMIVDGVRIPPDAVRLEEMVNYFDYSYAQPADQHPFAVHVDNAACPWNPDHQLLRVALKGREIERASRAPANLVFLLDVSGSMNDPRKLPLLAESMGLLVEELNASDTLSIVVYAGAEGLALPPTACDSEGRKKILSALRGLNAGGSTNGGAGIKLAYQTAREQFKNGGVNRVILATDGDFNVGVTEDGGLTRMVADNAKSNVFLTVLGFGTGNLNDGMMEAITNKGNGTYHYIDTLQEARRVLLQKMTGTLVTIAKDVKIQIEFNPARVRGYRLLGYANRMLRKEDFSNDKIDAGDIGAGHTVTAFYEIEPGDSRQQAPVEKLRYGSPREETPALPDASDEWLTVKLRYKQPEGERSELLEKPFIGSVRGFDEADADFRFASAVAMTGMLLRETEGTGSHNFAEALAIASASRGVDPHGQRAEFLKLIERLKTREPAKR